MDFTPQVEDEVIREAVSKTLDRPLVNTYNKLWRESKQYITPTSPFNIVDSLIYTNEVYNEMVDMVDINTNYTDRKSTTLSY